MKPTRHYTLTEAAKVLGITRAAVFEAIKASRLKATYGAIVQRTRGWRIRSADLHAYTVSLLHQAVGKKTL